VCLHGSRHAWAALLKDQRKISIAPNLPVHITWLHVTRCGGCKRMPSSWCPSTTEVAGALPRNMWLRLVHNTLFLSAAAYLCSPSLEIWLRCFVQVRDYIADRMLEIHVPQTLHPCNHKVPASNRGKLWPSSASLNRCCNKYCLKRGRANDTGAQRCPTQTLQLMQPLTCGCGRKWLRIGLRSSLMGRLQARRCAHPA
jgi:hypothetical protein